MNKVAPGPKCIVKYNFGHFYHYLWVWLGLPNLCWTRGIKCDNVNLMGVDRLRKIRDS